MYFSTVILFIGLIIGCCSALDSTSRPTKGRENLKNAITECKNQTGTNEDEVKDIMRHIIPNTRNGQCMVACIEKKIGIMGDDNKISMEKAKQKFALLKQHREDMYNKIIETIQECQTSETAVADECVAGLKFAECMYPKDRPFGPPSHDFINECKNKSGVNEHEFQNFIRTKIPETKNEQCMLACTEKRKGYIGTDNKINITNITQHLSHMNKWIPELLSNKILQIHMDCQDNETTEIDECVAAKKYAECVFPKLKQLHGPHHHFKKAYEECINQTGATKEDMKMIHSTIIPQTKNAQCLLACTEKKTGLRGEDNKIVVEKLPGLIHFKSHHNKELYDKILKIHQDCAAAETTEADECVAAFKYAQCVRPKLESTE